MRPATHVLSIDVEDWHNGALLLCTGRALPPTSAVETYTKRLFDLVQQHEASATWFFLGDVAQQYPELVRMVVDAGHEVGVHGFHHHRVFTLNPKDFQRSIIRAKDTIEQAAGQEAPGYRAVAASISRDTWYVYDALLEAGFRYSSSIYPFRGPRYGIGDAPVDAHWVTAPCGQQIFEIPFSVAEIAGFRLPCCGGGYLRHFPLAYTKAAMKLIGGQGRPAVVYLHPYELEHPARLTLVPTDLPLRERAKLHKLALFQFRNRGASEDKIRYLLDNFRFGSFEQVFSISQLHPPSGSDGPVADSESASP